MASAIFYDALLIKACGLKLNIINFEYMFSNMTQLRKGGAFLLQAIKLADNLFTFYPGEVDFWKQQAISCSLVSLTKKEKSFTSIQEHHIVWLGEFKNTPYNFYDVVEIIERLSKKVPNVKMDMICAEAEPEKIYNFENRAKDFGVSDKIVLHNTTDTIDEIYQNADICLMTSEYEIFPAALLKACEYNVPVISYEQPCIYEFADRNPVVSVPKKDFLGVAEILSEYFENNVVERGITGTKRFSLTEVIFLHYKYGVMKYKRQVAINKKLESELKSLKLAYEKLEENYRTSIQRGKNKSPLFGKRKHKS